MRRAQRGLRRFVIAGCLLASAAAWGQGLPSTGSATQITPLTPAVTLIVTVEQAMLIVQTLGQLGGCDRVSGMATCVMARALILEIQEQVKAQQK